MIRNKCIKWVNEDFLIHEDSVSYLFLTTMSPASSAITEKNSELLMPLRSFLNRVNPISAFCSLRVTGKKYFCSLIQLRKAG